MPSPVLEPPVELDVLLRASEVLDGFAYVRGNRRVIEAVAEALVAERASALREFRAWVIEALRDGYGSHECFVGLDRERQWRCLGCVLQRAHRALRGSGGA